MIKEFTASTYIIREDQVLLIFHPKLAKWLPPGGHVEANESPAEAAKREVLEETGLEIEFIQQENVWVNCWNAKSFERPYLCLVEEIPLYQDMPAHQHLDFVYVATPTKQVHPCGEIPYRWFGLDELQTFKADQDIFKETLEIIQHLLMTLQNKKLEPQLIS